VLDLEAHPLFLEPGLGLHAGAALGLLEAELALALVRELVFLDLPYAIFFIATAPLDLLARAAFRVLARAALGLDPGLGFRLFLSNPVVLDPTELFQGEQDGVLTLLGHVVPSPTGDEANVARHF
jgi:hypothetical protein